MAPKLRIQQGDITAVEMDAIVNSANNDLILGAGVSGAIRRIGGPAIQEECHAIGTIPLGEAVVTTAGNLKCKWIIHAATNPLGLWANAKSVRNAMRSALKKAIEKGIKTLAVPAIGAGSGGFPIDVCADVLYDVIKEHAAGDSPIDTITFVLFDEKSFKIFEDKFMRKFPEHWTEMTGKPLPEMPPEDDKKPLPEDLIPIVVPRRQPEFRPRPDQRRDGPRRDDRRDNRGPRPPGPPGQQQQRGPQGPRDNRGPRGPQQQGQRGQGPRPDDRRGPPPNQRGQGPRPEGAQRVEGPGGGRRDRGRDRGPRPPRPQGPPPGPRPQGEPPVPRPSSTPPPAPPPAAPPQPPPPPPPA